ncbi:MAG: substrate-binding domain-containing protein [Rhizobiaceae bacterium]
MKSLQDRTKNQQPGLRILSAGAPKAGVRRCAEFFFEKTGNPFEIEFATAPAIGIRVSAGTANADIVIAPATMLEGFQEDGIVVDGSVVALGSVSVGVSVRINAPEPDLSSVEKIRQALLAADKLIYNRASSGQQIEKLIDDFGIAKSVTGKTVRTETGASAMEHLARDRSRRAIGFGQIPEIKLHAALGIQLVGPLPRELNLNTSYCAGLSIAAKNTISARTFLTHIGSQKGRNILVESGLE